MNEECLERGHRFLVGLRSARDACAVDVIVADQVGATE